MGQKINFFQPIKVVDMKRIKSMSKKNLSFFQASIRYPKIKAFDDSDRDGILNAFDCKPFNRKKHGDMQTIPRITNSNIKIIPASPQQIMNLKRQRQLAQMANIRLSQQQRISQQRAAQQAAYAAEQAALAQEEMMDAQTPAIQHFDQIRGKAWQVSDTFRTGNFDEGDYSDAEIPIDNYVGSGSGSSAPVRAFSASGIKYG